MMNKELKQFGTVEELKRAYAEQVWQIPHLWSAAPVSYVPHAYRGGHVIRGFGYSTERVGAMKNRGTEIGHPENV